MDPHFWVWVLMGGVAAWLLSRVLRPPAPEEQADAPTADRVAQLCRALSGDPTRDRPLMNRVLALGPGVVPTLLQVLAEDIREEGPPARLARLEDLLAEFGLAAVPPLAELLGRLRLTSGLAASLVRVLRRLGQPGLTALVTLALDQPALAPCLPRFRRPAAAGPFPPVAAEGGESAAASTRISSTSPAPVRIREAGKRDVSAAVSAALATRPGRLHRADLDRVVGLIAASPAVVDDLWAAWGAEGRALLLAWLRDWLPLAQGAHVAAGLADPADAVRAEAARLAALCVAPAWLPALAELATTGDAAGRLAAVRALRMWPVLEADEALVQAAGDADGAVAAAAIWSLAGRPQAALAAGVAAARVLEADPVGAVMAAEVASEAGDVGALLAALGTAAGPGQVVLVALLGRHLSRDPRARERLIRLAGGEARGARVLALQVLAAHRDPTAADLLASALAHPLDDDERFQVQLAARLLGPATQGPLVRRLTTDDPARLAHQLAVLRVQDHGDAVPALLHALEDARDPTLEATLGATLAMGGSAVVAAIDEALRLPGRGLVAPALHFLAAYGTREDLPRLVALFDRHPPLRGIVLALIELQGTDALPALQARLTRGGDDGPVLALERRIAILEATGRPQEVQKVV